MPGRDPGARDESAAVAAVDVQECPICAKHRSEGPLVGPLIHRDELLVVTHRAQGTLGYAFVETRRHVASLDQLSDAEASAVGLATARLARGFRAELAVEHVHTMVAGLAVPHLHQHVFVRHAGTPRSLGWAEPWLDAPRGDARQLAERLAPYLAPS